MFPIEDRNRFFANDFVFGAKIVSNTLKYIK